jgi:hypothetical protein
MSAEKKFTDAEMIAAVDRDARRRRYLQERNDAWQHSAAAFHAFNATHCEYCYHANGEHELGCRVV